MHRQPIDISRKKQPLGYMLSPNIVYDMKPIMVSFFSCYDIIILL